MPVFLAGSVSARGQEIRSVLPQGGFEDLERPPILKLDNDETPGLSWDKDVLESCSSPVGH